MGQAVDLEEMDSGEDNMSVSIELPADERDEESFKVREVAAAEQGGGGVPPGWAGATELKMTLMELLYV